MKHKDTNEICSRIVVLDSHRVIAAKRGERLKEMRILGRIQELRWVLGELRDNDMSIP